MTAPSASSHSKARDLFLGRGTHPHLATDPATHPAAFGKYHGLVHVTRLPRLNSLVPPLQDATVYGFISKRRRFYIEQLHIPPADEGSGGNEHTAPAASLLCVPTKASRLEF